MIKKIVFLFIITISTFEISHAQTVAGSEANGLAGNAVCLKGAFATFNNPAALFDLGGLEAGLQIQRRFNTDVKHSNLSFAFPVNKITAGIGLDNFGNKLYSENVIQLALANKIAALTGVGLAVQWVHFSSLGNGNRNRLALQMGFSHGFNKKLKVGFNFKNIALQSGFLEKEKRETSAQGGLQYTQNEKVTLYTTIGGSTLYKSFGAIGVQYAASKFFTGRIGFSTGNEPVAVGFGLNLKKITLNVAVKTHATLGFSPEISLVYRNF